MNHNIYRELFYLQNVVVCFKAVPNSPLAISDAFMNSFFFMTFADDLIQKYDIEQFLPFFPRKVKCCFSENALKLGTKFSDASALGIQKKKKPCGNEEKSLIAQDVIPLSTEFPDTTAQDRKKLPS